MDYYASETGPGTDVDDYQRDLFILHQLKESIRQGQHPYYRPIPRPDKLYNLYLGPRQGRVPEVQQVPPHPEQIPVDSQNGYHLSQGELGSASHAIVVDTDSCQSSVNGDEPEPAQAQPAHQTRVSCFNDLSFTSYSSFF
jgi:hypothetical protein